MLQTFADNNPSFFYSKRHVLCAILNFQEYSVGFPDADSSREKFLFYLPDGKFYLNAVPLREYFYDVS